MKHVPRPCSLLAPEARRAGAGLRFLPSRRSVLMALAGAAAMAPLPIRAQQNSNGGSSMYFVPGGRIGFRKPEGVDVWSNRWILPSKDHTFRVEVHETLRVSPEYDSRRWDKDSRSQRIAATLALDGFEARRFRYLASDPSPDYAKETVVLRDARWMGEVQVSNNSLGLITHPGGQNARWRGAMDAILGSIVVRPQPAIADALGELGISLDTTGLHPRMVGERLILSLDAPRNGLEALGDGYGVIRTGSLTLMPPGATTAEREQHIDEDLSISKKERGIQVLVSPSCQGIVLKESEFLPGHFATTLHAYGRTRHLKFTASYDRKNRGRTLDALHRVFQSLTLHDVS
jgi:hypothetical protein